MQKKFTHLNEKNQPSMVDVGQKQATRRTAKARSIVVMDKEIIAQLEAGQFINPKKGPVFHTAILAGIMAAKKTAELIPLCHPVGMDDCQVTIEINEQKEIVIDCSATVFAKTGIEMEAITGASVAALTIYDMCKAFSHDIVIKETKLMEKTGGKKDFLRND
ncbi:MAG: cyclic pyranopterin phosphate synthase [Polaribacter sp.]|jgi:cyclic pyranopterin phosphate synthase